MQPRIVKMNRRDFLKLTGLTSAGLALVVYLDGCAPEQPTEVPTSAPTTSPTSTPGPTPLPTLDWTPNIYLHLDDNGVLTVVAFRSEMGQGVRTAIAMVIADELDVDWANVRIIQAPADVRYGSQFTGGSASISSTYGVINQAGAVAREMLITTAASVWGVDPTQCETEPGFVIHPDKVQKLAYGGLVAAASKLEVPEMVDLRNRNTLRIIGTGKGQWDASAILTGKAVYGLDLRIPGMLYAAFARSPVFGGRFTSHDDSATLAVPGVRQVVEIRDDIAVVADNSWAAIRGRDALRITWDEGENATLNSTGLREEAANQIPQAGSAGEGFIDAVYYLPYEAHMTMEPMNSTAWEHDGIMEIWAPTQNPQGVQRDVSAETGIRIDKVVVNVPLIGGGFGRRLETDYGVEAALLAQAIQAPVKVVWTRADDIHHDYCNDMGLFYMTASLSDLRIPSPVYSATGGLASNSNSKVGPRSVPTGAWRSVHEFTNGYVTQCFLDEIAAALQRDPLDLRLELYSGKAEAVIQMAADKAGWGNPLPVGHFHGMAYHATFGATHVCHVVEISVNEDGQVRVHRVVSAVDCGMAVNPDHVTAQIQGGFIFGMTAALKAQATLENGRIIQSNFHDCPIVQINEAPAFETYLVESTSFPSGIGEMGVPPAAPAIANAVYAATGKRIRHIPILPEDLRD